MAVIDLLGSLEFPGVSIVRLQFPHGLGRMLLCGYTWQGGEIKRPCDICPQLRPDSVQIIPPNQPRLKLHTLAHTHAFQRAHMRTGRWWGLVHRWPPRPFVLCLSLSCIPLSVPVPRPLFIIHVHTHLRKCMHTHTRTHVECSRNCCVIFFFSFPSSSTVPKHSWLIGRDQANWELCA